MFITEEDYETLIDKNALSIVQQSTEENRTRAEKMSLEEITGYLCDRYNTNLAFSKIGDKRNMLVVMYAMDIALYNMIAWLPQKMGYEIRKERYENAIKWLNNVAKGLINPTLPAHGDDGSGEYDPDADTSGPVKWGSAEKNNNDW